MERIHVCVRPRPLSPDDAKSSPWRISANSIFIPNQSSKFDFDRVFGEECATAEVYSCRTQDIVEAAVRGFNGTVFAYGQTSSGKTHTMRGSASEPGVIPLAVHDLFEKIHEEVDREFLLRMSYMEIYNEEINDLLAPEHRKLQIHESIERGIFVAGLREEIVASPDQVLGLMEFGESHRHIGETNMNLYSSRSHTIFRMIIESKEKTEDLENSCDAVRVSVLNLVDLAGSERAAKTGAEGVRLKEGSHINKSLMTLGTVIKKLSEGVESQGGHVPYRDSKLTRILQPALGGNANTAIICNITLAQIHADETKSSLLFASRALHVTNCAHVNEILTDAALLKRQKKEIEELRAKLLGNMDSHSEHLEDEVLNLRNALLKAELERERIALELEEEKRAHAERDKRLQEQARKIENLSSMVLCSTRSDPHDTSKKEKRRLTWCPGKMSRETWNEPCSTVEEEASVIKPGRKARDVAPLLPFEDLVKDSSVKPGSKACDVASFLPFEDPGNETSVADPCMEEEEGKISMKDDSILPNPLLYVTSRKKAAPRKKNLQMENDESAGIQLQYDDLLVRYETEKAMCGMELDHLKKRLALASLCHDERCNDSVTGHDNVGLIQSANQFFTETEALCLIKKLQDKITLLESEKSFSQKNLDTVVELASEQTMDAREKYEELYSALQEAKEEVKLARELSSWPLEGEGQCSDYFLKLGAEIQELLSESRSLTEVASSDMDDFRKYLSGVPSLLADLRSSALQASDEIRTTISCYQKLNCSLESRVNRLENEKMTLSNQSRDLQNQIEELSSSVQNSANALVELSEEYGLEQSELLAHIKVLEKEISCASSCSLAREKESLRKELEKVKSKLRDTEAKLKNCMQEKTKLEGEKACAEKENKLLRNQKNTLERDLSKHDSVFGKRGDSVAGNNASMFDAKRGWSPATAIDLEDYKNLEALASDLETKIASLEEELMVERIEKEEAISKSESLSCELNALSEEFNMTSVEVTRLEEETSTLKSCIKESERQNQDLRSSINTIMEEKEELALQFTDALLQLEEEKAIWSAKEKASIESIEHKVKLHNSEVNSLMKDMSEVKKELDLYKSECKTLEDRWKHSVEELELEKKCSAEKSLQIDRLREDFEVLEKRSKNIHESLTSQVKTLSLEHQRTCEELKRVQIELENLRKEREEHVSQRAALNLNSSLSRKQDETEKVKMRMRLRSMQIKLDTIRYRHNEAVNEMDEMNKNYVAASEKLKGQAVSYGVEVLNLRKHISACTCRPHDL